MDEIISPIGKKDSEKKKERKKKRKAAMKMYDARGVQTLFRNLARNHYQLLKMVDNKASIILTVNSIIISLLMGAIFITPENQIETMGTITTVMINFSMASMVFALISMLPHKYLGKKFRNSGYKGSLYAGNFSKMSLEDFHTAINCITKSGQNIYKEMTSDLYFLGKTIELKQLMIRISVLVFLSGLIWTIIYSSLYN